MCVNVCTAAATLIYSCTMVLDCTSMVKRKGELHVCNPKFSNTLHKGTLYILIYVYSHTSHTLGGHAVHVHVARRIHVMRAEHTCILTAIKVSILHIEVHQLDKIVRSFVGNFVEQLHSLQTPCARRRTNW